MYYIYIGTCDLNLSFKYNYFVQTYRKICFDYFQLLVQLYSWCNIM